MQLSNLEYSQLLNFKNNIFILHNTLKKDEINQRKE